MAVEQEVPSDFEAKSRQRYDAIPKPELAFPQFLQMETHEYHRANLVERDPLTRYTPGPSPRMTPCGNGNFDSSIDPNEWQGGWGSVDGNGDPTFATFTAGLFPGPLAASGSHQTWVAAGGTDPVTGIPVAAPGSSGSARIGNSATGRGAELLSKTFTVTPAQSLVRFWYAVVFDDFGHLQVAQPSFWVRVLHGSTYVGGLVNLGNGSDKLIASNSPFFQTVQVANKTIRYKDWSCAQINLSSLVGQQVTVQFVTEDCAGGAHYGYAYVGRFCGSCEGSPEGNLSFDGRRSSTCGKGQICFNYTLPRSTKPGGTVTGSITISLDIYQNGTLVTTLPSVTLTTGTSHCFAVDPSAIAGINPALGGFDFVGRATFALPGATPAPMVAGTAPTGQVLGQNNDYQIACRWCCPGENLVKNGGFDAAALTSGFASQYVFNGAVSPGATVPGTYNVVTALDAQSISPLWTATDHSTCKGASGPPGRFMVVNGRTGQAGSRIIWASSAGVAAGREYRFCAYVKNFRQCTFDVLPRVEVKFSVPNANIAPVVVNTTSSPCDWQLVSGTVKVPAGTTSLNMEVWLDETGQGDGNDLALDDISLQLKSTMDHNNVLFNVTPTLVAGTSHYNVSAKPVNLPPAYNTSYFWEVCELDAAGAPVNPVPNLPAWWTHPAACTFVGYNGGGTGPGRFDFGKRYRIRFGAWSDCEAWDESSWELRYDATRKKVEVSPVAPPTRLGGPVGSGGGSPTGRSGPAAMIPGGICC